MTDSDTFGSETEHDRGQRHGEIQTCDYTGCGSVEFNIVEDELTAGDLVVCVECGFTMGVLGR